MPKVKWAKKLLEGDNAAKEAETGNDSKSNGSRMHSTDLKSNQDTKKKKELDRSQKKEPKTEQPKDNPRADDSGSSEDNNSGKAGAGPEQEPKQSPRSRKKARKEEKTASPSEPKAGNGTGSSQIEEDKSTQKVKTEEKPQESPKPLKESSSSAQPSVEEKPASQSSNENFVDLKSIMDQKTEPKKFKAPESTQVIEENEEEKELNEDFEEVEPEIDLEAGNDTDLGQQEQSTQSGLSYEEQAKIVVASLDAAGGLFLPPAYKKKLFKKEDREKFAQCKQIYELKKSGVAKKIDIDEDLKPYYAKFLEFKDLVKDIDFTPEESKMLIKPLSGVFEKYDVQAGPEISLIMAAAMVITPRLTPLFFD